MVLKSHNLGHLALDYPVYESATTATSYHPHRPGPGRRPSSRSHTNTLSRTRLQSSQSVMRSLTDVTDVVAIQPSWSRVPLPCPEVPSTSMRSQWSMDDGRGQNTSSLGYGNALELRGFTAYGRWDDLEDKFHARPSPPKTPQPVRLRTPDLPELALANEGSRFCPCCAQEEPGYKKGRAKMDSQRESITPAHCWGWETTEPC